MVAVIKAADWAIGGFSEHVPRPVLMVVGFAMYGAMFTAAAGILNAAIRCDRVANQDWVPQQRSYVRPQTTGPGGLR